jgi:hypothetical protein
MGVRLIAAGVALGVLGDLLFQGHELGLNAVLWAGAFVLALALLVRFAHAPLHQGRRLMAAPLLVFALLLAWRDSALLVAVNLFAIAGAVTLGALRRTRPTHATVADYVLAAAQAGSAAAAGTARLLRFDVPWQELGANLRGARTAAVGRGVALGLPLVVLFGALFVGADAIFRQLLTSALPDVRTVWLHVLIALCFGWLAAGLLRDLVAVRGDRLLNLRRTVSTEVAVALAAVDVLFLCFVLVQLRYLFGGRGLVEERVHLTYAQYARHGFFELVAVAVLVLPLLVAANTFVRSRLVRLLSFGLVALVFVVMASALQRLRLYQQEYGLTELRLYATGVVLWLALVFALLAVTVLRGRPRPFALGAIVLGFAATLALNVLNPDALIVRTNLSRPQVDAAYLARLSDDAVPTLLQRLPTLERPLQRSIAQALLARDAQRDLVGWNASRARATSMLASHHDELARLAR